MPRLSWNSSVTVRVAESLWRDLAESDESFIVPHLLDVEVTSALRRLVAGQRIDSHRSEEFLDGLALLPAERYSHIPLLGRIWELRHNFTAYDAAYIALAEATGAVLYTCDEKLRKGHRAQVVAFRAVNRRQGGPVSAPGYHVLVPAGSSLYCDVSLPVPLDQPFTYALPETLRHRVREGSRIVVPFGARKLTGVILRCHDDPPEVKAREALRLIDAEPVLSAELLALGHWISGYYCAPLGEVLRGMLPLASEIRRGKIWSLTDSGRDAARQLLLDTSPDDPVSQVLRMLEKRPLSAAYLAKALPLADKAIRSLERKRFIVAEQVQTERDPLRAPAERLRIELTGTAPRRQTQQSRARTAGVSRTASRLAQPEGCRRRGEEREHRRRGRWRASAR